MAAYVVAAALLLTGCASSQKPPCTEAQLSALRHIYERAASQVIASGECDGVQLIQNCNAYKALELHFEVASKAMCQ